MTRGPVTVLLHTATNSHWVDADALAAAVTDRLPDLDLRVARTPGESLEMVAGAEVALSAWLPPAVLEATEGLRWVQALSAGVDFYDREGLRENGVLLTNAAGIHAEPIAEQVLGYLLLFERRILQGVRQQAEGLWQRYEGSELRGKTVGIVGVGREELGIMGDESVLVNVARGPIVDEDALVEAL